MSGSSSQVPNGQFTSNSGSDTFPAGTNGTAPAPPATGFGASSTQGTTDSVAPQSEAQQSQATGTAAMDVALPDSESSSDSDDSDVSSDSESSSDSEDSDVSSDSETESSKKKNNKKGLVAMKDLRCGNPYCRDPVGHTVKDCCYCAPDGTMHCCPLDNGNHLIHLCQKLANGEIAWKDFINLVLTGRAGMPPIRMPYHWARLHFMPNTTEAERLQRVPQSIQFAADRAARGVFNSPRERVHDNWKGRENIKTVNELIKKIGLQVLPEDADPAKQWEFHDLIPRQLVPKPVATGQNGRGRSTGRRDGNYGGQSSQSAPKRRGGKEEGKSPTPGGPARRSWSPSPQGPKFGRFTSPSPKSRRPMAHRPAQAPPRIALEYLTTIIRGVGDVAIKFMSYQTRLDNRHSSRPRQGKQRFPGSGGFARGKHHDWPKRHDKASTGNRVKKSKKSKKSKEKEGKKNGQGSESRDHEMEDS